MSSRKHGVLTYGMICWLLSARMFIIFLFRTTGESLVAEDEKREKTLIDDLMRLQVPSHPVIIVMHETPYKYNVRVIGSVRIRVEDVVRQ